MHPSVRVQVSVSDPVLLGRRRTQDRWRLRSRSSNAGAGGEAGEDGGKGTGRGAPARASVTPLFLSDVLHMCAK